MTPNAAYPAYRPSHGWCLAPIQHAPPTVWEERGTLVVEQGAALPDICLGCGCAGASARRVTVTHIHMACFLACIASPLLGMILFFALREQRELALPHCTRCASRLEQHGKVTPLYIVAAGCCAVVGYALMMFGRFAFPVPLLPVLVVPPLLIMGAYLFGLLGVVSWHSAGYRMVQAPYRAPARHALREIYQLSLPNVLAVRAIARQAWIRANGPTYGR